MISEQMKAEWYQELQARLPFVDCALDSHLERGTDVVIDATRFVVNDPPRFYLPHEIPLMASVPRRARITTESKGEDLLQTVEFGQYALSRVVGAGSTSEWLHRTERGFEKLNPCRMDIEHAPSGEAVQRACLVTLARNEAPYVLDWVAYNVALGFEKIIVYYNDCADRTVELLSEIAKVAPVVLRNNEAIVAMPGYSPEQALNPQTRAYYRFISEREGAECDWAAFFDIDEFFVPKKQRSVSEFLRYRCQADAVAVNWRIFGSSGRNLVEDSPVIARFRFASARNWPYNGIVKSFVKCDKIRDMSSAHVARLKPSSADYIYADGNPFCFGDNPEMINHEYAQLNHYIIKTPIEYYAKRERGDVIIDKSTMVAKTKYTSGFFLLNDVDCDLDESAMDLAPEFESVKKRMLAKNPKIGVVHKLAFDEFYSKSDFYNSHVPPSVRESTDRQSRRLMLIE